MTRLQSWTLRLMFFGLPYSQALCCAFCATPAPDFRGCYWGVVGNKITRLAEYILYPDSMLAPATEFYTYPNRKAHPNFAVTLPNLTDDNDVERECFGAACTMLSDCTVDRTLDNARVQFLYAWCHYVPVGETNLDNAIAAFACLEVTRFNDSSQGPWTLVVNTPTVWFARDAAGEYQQWDDPDKLDCHYDHRHAFVGRGAVGWFDKRISSGTQNRITIHPVGQETPSVHTYDNPAHNPEPTDGLYVVDVSRRSYPLALGCDVDSSTFGDSTYSSINRFWHIGDLNTGTGKLEAPISIDETDWDLALTFRIAILEPGVRYGSGTRESTAAPDDLVELTRVIVRDWGVGGTNFYTEVPPDDFSTIHDIFGHGLVNAYFGFAGDPFIADSSTRDDYWEWKSFTSTAYSTTVEGPDGTELVDCPVGQETAPLDIDSNPRGILRIYEVYGNFSTTDARWYECFAEFAYANEEDGSSRVYFYPAFVGPERDNINPEASQYPIVSALPDLLTVYNEDLLQVAALRAPSDNDSAIVYGDDPIPYYRGFIGGASITANDPSLDRPGNQREQVISTGSSFHMTGTPASFDFEQQGFFVKNGATLDPIAAPTGFWVDPNDGDPVIMRGRFAVADAYDNLTTNIAVIYQTTGDYSPTE